MPESFSHCLAAIAVQGVIGYLAGFELLSAGIFLSGIVAMGIDMDQSSHSNRKRSPYSHSFVFSVIWMYAGWTMLFLSSNLGLTPKHFVMEGTLAIAIAFLTHLALDLFTKEGIFTYPKSMTGWLDPHKDGNLLSWEQWGVIRLPNRWRFDEGHGVLNTLLCTGSLLALVIFIALTPL